MEALVEPLLVRILGRGRRQVGAVRLRGLLDRGEEETDVDFDMAMEGVIVEEYFTVIVWLIVVDSDELILEDLLEEDVKVGERDILVEVE